MSPVADLPIRLDREAIGAFCRRHHLRKLSLSGSVLTDRFGPESDVDVRVESESGAVIGLFEMAAMEIELGDMVGREVDLRTPEDLSRHFREEVVSRAEPVYAA